VATTTRALALAVGDRVSLRLRSHDSVSPRLRVVWASTATLFAGETLGMPDSAQYVRGMERLVVAIQELSLARDLDGVMQIVRRAARELSGADGATFVLRDGGCCFYAEEDAIAPLWKGKRFPLETCISGWVMLHSEAVTIEDIYIDPRIPADAYRPTFVKSLAMVPIRRGAPVGAIGNYWASRRKPTEEELKLLQALADSTSVAMENTQILAELEARVRARTAELEAANHELEAFSYSVSHDLRAPLRSIDGFSRALEEDAADVLDANARDHLGRVRGAVSRMNSLIEDMLELARVTRVPLRHEPIDLTAQARLIVGDLAFQNPLKRFDVQVADGLAAEGDPSLVRAVLENLLGNAFKFASRTASPRIEVGRIEKRGETIFFVRDNGAGFDQAHAQKLFAPFQRLHTAAEFPGTGVGLATVQRIVRRHGGRIWAEARPGEGATFWFSLASPPRAASTPSAPPR
jgi:signal transduction histidine kinase